MIVGMVGLIGSGKDTAADYFVHEFGFRRESFASILKDAVSIVFGWDRTMLEGRTAQSREWREQIDPWWAQRLNIPHLTPRWVLQYWGTDVLRKGFHDDIWIAGLENKLRNSNDNIVISDCRFPNEISAIQNQGGKMVWVQRGPLPTWYDYAVVANKSTDMYNRELAKEYLDKHKIHASETSWVGTEFDYIVDNNSSLDNLFSQLKNLVQY